MSLRGLASFLAAALVAGCAGKKDPEQLQGAGFYYDKGMEDFEKGRYLRAVDNFQRVLSNYPGFAEVAEAQYHLAESFFHLEEYVSAVFEYERLVDTYPSSARLVEAQYKIGESYFEQSRRAELDQAETYQALAAYRRFIEDNPGSELVADANGRIRECRGRLAEKDFLAARLYHRQGHLDAAKMTYEQMVRAYPDTDWYWQGLARIGRIHSRQGRPDEAQALWDEVLSGSGDEDLLEDVREWIAEAGQDAE